MNKDCLQRFLFDKAPIRGEYVGLQESYQTIINQHDYPPSIRQLLGEALCVASLLSAIIKFKGRLTVQFRGKEKLKLLLAQCDDQFNLRGVAKWDGEMSYEDLMDSLSHGMLIITLDSGPSKRYQGIVAWRGNSLAESIEGYFRDSEQLDTKIWLAINETTAVGYLLQAIPRSEGDVTHIEDEASSHWERITQLTMGLDAEQMLSMEYETLLASLYPEEDVRIFPASEIKFKCTCTRKRGQDAILILGQKEAEEELKDKNVIVVTCDFCNKEYIFDRKNVTKIFEKNDNLPPDTQIH